MAKKYFLASVANVDAFRNESGILNHVLSARTLTDSSIGFSSTQEEVRAGQGAKLYGRFNHDTSMTLSLTDAMFDLNYIRLQIGAENITDGATIIKNDSAATYSSGTLTLSEVPQAIGNACGLDAIVVWAHAHGCDSSAQDVSITIPASSAAKTISITNAADQAALEAIADPVDNTICAEYFVLDQSNQTEAIRLVANYIPAELVIIMRAQLFAGEAGATSNGTAAGYVTVKVPRFQLDGSFDLSMAMSSASTFALNGTALAVEDGTCDGAGVYGEITVNYTSEGAIAYKAIFIDNDTVKAGTDLPVVYGVQSSGAIVKLAIPDNVSATDTTWVIKKGSTQIAVSDGELATALAASDVLTISYKGNSDAATVPAT